MIRFSQTAPFFQPNILILTKQPIEITLILDNRYLYLAIFEMNRGFGARPIQTCQKTGIIEKDDRLPSIHFRKQGVVF